MSVLMLMSYKKTLALKVFGSYFVNSGQYIVHEIDKKGYFLTDLLEKKFS
jgi:hypothetical protein